MEVRKAFGQVFGANLNANERKALDIEIRKELADFTRRHAMEVDATFLCILQDQLGFGEVRLKRFFDEFSPAIQALADRYEAETDDELTFVCTYKLKERGIDLAKWYEEKYGKEPRT